MVINAGTRTISTTEEADPKVVGVVPHPSQSLRMEQQLKLLCLALHKATRVARLVEAMTGGGRRCKGKPEAFTWLCGWRLVGWKFYHCGL